MLHTLEIYALRGATEKFVLPFEKGKKITILYGENGSGKSTICDSLELLSDGKVGSLDDKGLGKTISYWPSTGKKPSDLSVILKTSNGQWEVKLAKSKAVVTPDAGRPQVKILRRNQLLNLIAAQPSARYEVISPFIDISGAEKSENSLRGLLRSESASMESASARIEENRAALERFWEQAGRQGASALDWARSEVRKPPSALDEEINRIEGLAAGCEALLAEDRQMRQNLQAVTIAEEELKAADERVEQEKAQALNTPEELVEILEAARKYFHGHIAPTVCPLCDSAEFAAGLPDKVNAKLTSIRSLADAMRIQSSARQSLEAARKQIEQQSLKLLDATVRLSQVITQDAWPSDVVVPRSLSGLAIQFQAGAPDLQTQQTKVPELIAEATAFLPAAQAALEMRREKKGFIYSLEQAVATYDANYSAQQERDRLIPLLKQALEEVEKERQEFVNNILDRIAARVGGLYEEIHPEEGLGKINLLLDPGKRASLEIQSHFPEAQNAPPGAYFSESHLDTLGLCIWLALAERRDAANTVLVLDDVIGSVDDLHADRIIEMLYTVAQKFQHCILTTHYRPWREKYRWGWLGNGQCQFIELQGWEHGAGIRYGKSVPPVEELRWLLDNEQPSPQLICSSAGVILEGILDFLTQLYECSVPRRKGKLALGDLLPNVNKKLRAALKVERVVKDAEGKIIRYDSSDIGSILDELQNMAQLRNVFGCHFNDLAHYLPTTDAVEFATKVHDLASLIIDAESGWPMSDKSGSYWATSGETVRLHPLKQPR